MRMGVKGTPSIEKWLQAAPGMIFGLRPLCDVHGETEAATGPSDEGPRPQPWLSSSQTWSMKCGRREDPPAQHISLLDESTRPQRVGKVGMHADEMAKARSILQ